MSYRHISDEPNSPITGTDLVVYDRPGSPYTTFNCTGDQLATFVGSTISTSVTLVGDVTGSGSSPITTTYNGVVPGNKGGTGISSYTVGDLLYASGTTTLSKLPVGGANTVLHGGTTPSYSYLDVSTQVQGVLQEANGGTGESTYTDGQITIGNTSTGGLKKGTIVADANITVTYVDPDIHIAASGMTGVTDIIGTADEVLANGTSGSSEAGSVTLTTPQPIGLTSDVEFGSINTYSSSNESSIESYDVQLLNPAEPIQLLTFTASGSAALAFTYTYGRKFTVGAQELYVTHLAYSSVYFTSGTRQVGLWDDSGTLLSSVTITYGTDFVMGNFIYKALPKAVLLSASTAYRIGGLVAAGETIPGFTPTWYSGITDDGTYSNLGGTLAFPGTSGPLNYMVAGAMFLNPAQSTGLKLLNGQDQLILDGKASYSDTLDVYGQKASINTFPATSTEGWPYSSVTATLPLGTDQVYGIHFIVGSENIYITHLGFNATYLGSWPVGIYTDPDGTLLTSVTVTSSDPTTGSFKYQKLSNPIKLLAGRQYCVAGQMNTGGGRSWDIITNVAYDAAITFVNITTETSSSLIYPDATTTALASAFGAGMMFVSESDFVETLVVEDEVVTANQLDVTTTSSLGTVTSGTWNGTVIGATYGGTGQSSYAVGDIIYASTTTALSKLADVATGNALISGGVSTAPAWGKIGLTTHVSGTLPVANGGTGITTGTSGGLVYFSGTGTIASSGAYTQGNILFGNGAGNPPATDGTNFFWDDTNNRLGVGVNSPASPLNIKESTSTTGTANGLTIEQASTGDATLQYLLTSGTRVMHGIDNSDSDSYKETFSTDLATTPHRIVTTAGIQTMPLQPSCSVYNNANQTNVTGDGTNVTVTFNTKVWDLSNNYSANQFTAPVTGRYLITWSYYLSGLTAGTSVIQQTIVTSNVTYNALYRSQTAGTTLTFATGSVIADLDASDVAFYRIQCHNTAKVVTIVHGRDNTGFRVFLLC